jgi:chloramphenicol 3-O phosphotransferase
VRRRGLVIVLDGPTQVGCSTTLHALQRAWPQVRPGPLMEVGLDAALGSFGPGARRWSELVLPRLAGGTHAAWGPMGRELVAAMHRAAAAWAHGGFDVAVDHVLLDRATLTDLVTALSGLDVLYVGLTCDPDVLEDREREAGVATPGLAEAQQEATRDLLLRDLELDTSYATTDELVEAVLSELARLLRR